VCGVVGFLNAYRDTPIDPLNFCGNPVEHWDNAEPCEPKNPIGYREPEWQQTPYNVIKGADLA
jgi:hypothetical protein